MKIDLQRSSGISPYSSKDVIISVKISSGLAASCLIIFFNAACTSDLRIFWPSMFFGIGGISPLSSSNNSQIYSIHLSRIICISMIIVPSLDFTHPEDEQVLLPVSPVIFLYIDVISFSLACSISLHWMPYQDSFASIHCLFISLSSVLYV